jgi:hypothetical protein
MELKPITVKIDFPGEATNFAPTELDYFFRREC